MEAAAEAIETGRRAASVAVRETLAFCAAKVLVFATTVVLQGSE
jgi:hypothetical protein